MRKLYLVSQYENNDWDTYDSFVICTNSEEKAKNTMPGYSLSSWTTPDRVYVKYLGRADSKVPLGIVCSSFNAG